MSTKQQTIQREFSFSGKGLHTAAESSVVVRPGDPDTGFVFEAGGKRATVDPRRADGARHRTILDVEGQEIHTVEHLLAALYGMGVDNALIAVEGGEVPGLDGSASSFSEAVAEVGLVEQDAERKVLNLQEPVAVAYKGSSVTAFPSTDGQFRVTYVLDYPESPLAQGTAELVIDAETVRQELAPCRTFVMKEHAQALLEAGLGQGANTENTLVLDGATVVDNELRFADECARHKVLDVVGDLATVGRRLAAHVVAYKSGHALNLELAQALARAALKQEHPRGILDIKGISEILPHRYPFLLVDRVIELEWKKRIVAYKNVTRNEEFFNGHFPGQPIMPGVLQVEALAQAGGIAMLGDQIGKLAVLMSVDEVKYRRPVVPGDRFLMTVEIEKLRGKIGVARAKATVDGEVTTSCVIKFAVVSKEEYIQ